MAYQAKRSKKFQEDFDLVDEKGNVYRKIHVSLDADDMVVKINRKYVALTKALADTTEAKRKAENAEDMEKCFDALGRAMVDLLTAVFGEKNTGTIVQFYDNRYIEMSREVLPFITHIVIPRLAEIRKENQKTMMARYNRKQRRSLFGSLK